MSAEIRAATARLMHFAGAALDAPPGSVAEADARTSATDARDALTMVLEDTADRVALGTLIGLGVALEAAQQ